MFGDNMPRNFSKHAEAELRGRSIVISGLDQSAESLPPFRRRSNLLSKLLGLFLTCCRSTVSPRRFV